MINFRGINLTSPFSRLDGRILRSFIEKHMKVEVQCGFRSGRYCMDNIFVLKQIIEKRLSIGKDKFYFLFIDPMLHRNHFGKLFNVHNLKLEFIENVILNAVKIF